MTRIQRVCSSVDRPEAVEPDVGRLEVSSLRGSPRRLGWGLAAGHGLDPTLSWYGTDRDHLGRRGQSQIPHGLEIQIANASRFAPVPKHLAAPSFEALQ